MNLWGTGQAMPAYYIYWGNSRGSTSLLATGGTLSFWPNRVNLPADEFTFSTTGAAYSDALAKADIENINVYPNPYYGFHSLELTRQSKWMQFTNLPEEATIRIFNLGGIMVWMHNKDASSNVDQNVRWNLQNQAGFPVASGIYIAHIDMPGIGTKVLKLALVQEQQILQKY